MNKPVALSTRAAALLLALLLALSAAGCAAAPPPASEASPPEASVPTAPSQPAVPASVVDHLGRTVAIPQTSERIVSGYYITTSLLIALGLEDRVAGVEAKADSRPVYALAAPEFLELPNVGTAKEFDLEGCLALEPDLVILPVKLKDSVKTLEEMGVTVLAVNPEDDTLLRETIEMVAAATKTAERAGALLDELDRRADALLLKRAVHSALPGVYFGGNSSLLSTAGSKMYQNSLISLAGGVNVAAEIEDAYWATISYEQLLAYDPDVIVLAPGAVYTKEEVLSDPKLAGLSAVRTGRIHRMPDAFEAWDSPVPSSILGAEWLYSLLFDEKESFEEFQRSAVAFYLEFYGVDIDASLLTQ